MYTHIYTYSYNVVHVYTAQDSVVYSHWSRRRMCVEVGFNGNVQYEVNWVDDGGATIQ